MTKTLLPTILLLLLLPLFGEPLFYLPFEGDGNALYAKGDNRCAGTGRYVPGRVGQGIKPTSQLTYAAAENINYQQGSISLFFTPQVDMESLVRSGKRWNLFAFQHLRLRIHDQFVVFMTGYYKENGGAKEFKWDYSLTSQRCRKWKAGEAHHIAVTWNNQERVLYFDGQPVCKVENGNMPKEALPAEKIKIGDGDFPGWMDEVTLFDRPLAQNEVEKLFTAPEAHGKAMGEKGRVLPVASGEIPGETLRQALVEASMDLREKPAALLGKSEGTVSFFYLPPAENSDVARYILHCGGFRFDRPPKTKLVRFYSSELDANGKQKQTPFSAFYRQWEDSAIHHIAYTYRIVGKRIVKSIYVDGEFCGDKVSDVAEEYLFRANQTRIQLFNGATLRDLRFFNRELKEFDILRILTTPVEGVPKHFATMAAKRLQEAAQRQGLSAEYIQSSPEKTIVAPGESFMAEFKLRNKSLQNFKGEVQFTLKDFYGNAVSSQKESLQLSPGERKSYQLPLKAEKRGPYLLEAAWEEQGKRRSMTVSAFSVWSSDKKLNPNSFFGHHVNTFSPKLIDQAARLGEVWLRNHNTTQITWWDRVQPEPGEFRWTLDGQLKEINRHGMRIFGQLFTTPYWAAEAGPQEKKKGYNPCWKPDEKAFYNYVYHTVKHYKDYIQTWEIWNEPEVALFWKGTPEEFAQLAQVARKAAIAADPKCRLAVAGHTIAAWNWHSRAAKAGLYDGMDIISIHCNPGRADTQAEKHLRDLRQTLKHFYSISIPEHCTKMPIIWNSEGGAPSSTFFENLDLPQLPPLSKRKAPDARRAAYNLVKGTASFMRAGIQKHFIYTQQPLQLYAADLHYNNSMLDVNLAPKPTLMARTAMREQLDWATWENECYSAENGRFWVHLFNVEKGNKTILLLFCGEDGKLELSLPAQVKGFDLFGNPLAVDSAKITVTEEPIYLHVNMAPSKVLQMLRTAKIKVLVPPQPLVEMEEKKEADHGVPYQPDYATPSERPANLFTVDLRPFCNMGFADEHPGDGRGGWTDEGDMNDLRDFKPGLHRYFDVPFNIIDPKTNQGKAVISLYGEALTRTLPVEVCGIPVNRNAWKLYFLHAAGWGIPGDCAEYVIHYEDDTKATFRVNIPRHCGNWHQGPAQEELSRIIPVKVTNTLNGKPAWRYLRCIEWENPHPGKNIKSLDLRSLKGKQTPIIIAISGV